MNDMTNVAEIERQIEAGELSADDPQVIDLINKLAGGEEPAAGDESGERADPAQEQAAAEAKAKAEADAKAAEEAAKAAAGEEQGKAILSKDGKHTIPYDVLETARANEEAAIAAAKQLAAVTQALEQQVRDLQAGKAGEGKPKADIPTLRSRLDDARKQVEEVSKEYPDLAPAQTAILDSMVAMAEQLFGEVGRQRDVIDQLGKVAAQTVNERQSAAKETAKDAIASVPALVVWQTKNPALFKLAATFDDTLKVDPDWKAKPMAERFQKAVEMVVAVKGPSVLDGIAPVQDTKTEPAKKATSASAALAAALGITSLSDLPGGSAVSQEPGALDALSESQLTEKLGNIKDDNDLLAFLANSVT